jgi:hypothetical protein
MGVVTWGSLGEIAQFASLYLCPIGVVLDIITRSQTTVMKILVLVDPGIDVMGLEGIAPLSDFVLWYQKKTY